MREGWTYKKLGEVATFSRGLTFSKNDEVEFSKNVVLRSNNIDLLSGKLDFSELKYLNERFEIPSDKRVKLGSLFICMSNGSKAHLGKVAYIDKDYGYAYGGFMGLISPINDVNGLYLRYVLTSPQYKEFIKSLSEGANINNLKFKDLSEYIIPLPPLPEQQSIVSRLDAAFTQIDELKTNAERQLAEACALFQKALTESMTPKDGWRNFVFSEIIKLQSGDYLSSKDYVDGEYPVYGGNGIAGYHNQFNKDGITIVVGRVGALCGNVHYVDSPIWLTDNGFEVIVKKDIDLDMFFLCWYLRFLDLGKYARQAAQPVISNSSLKDIVLYLPPLSEQQAIVSRLDALSENVRRYEEIQQKTITECDALKQALLREIFEE